MFICKKSRIAFGVVGSILVLKFRIGDKVRKKVAFYFDPNNENALLVERIYIKSKDLILSTFKKDVNPNRTHVVLLGSGWAATNFLNQIDTRKYRVTVISPRPFFLMTPLMTSVVGGKLNFRTIMVPLKLFLGHGRKSQKVRFICGEAKEVINENNLLVVSKGVEEILKFDKLVVGIGSDVNTFNIKGVFENCTFCKEIHDVYKIRQKIFNNSSKAANPSIDDETRKKLLHFVIVGGGATGTEAAAEINDLINSDLKKQFPQLEKFFKVTIIELQDYLVPGFGSEVGSRVNTIFKNSGINVLTKHQVVGVDKDAITVVDKDKNSVSFPTEHVIWATGIKQRPFSLHLIDSIPEQNGNRIINVDSTLKVIGSDNIYAFGDCAIVRPPKMRKFADVLYVEAALSRYGTTFNYILKNSTSLSKNFLLSQLHRHNMDNVIKHAVPTESTLKKYVRQELDKTQFNEMLDRIDKAYKPPSATAQMARQAGTYLASMLNKQCNGGSSGFSLSHRPFAPRLYGDAAYFGNGNGFFRIYLSSKMSKFLNHVPLIKTAVRKEPSSVNLIGNKVEYLRQLYYMTQNPSGRNKIVSIVDYLDSKIGNSGNFEIISR